MKKLNNYISVFFIAVAVIGLLGSLSHYHSEGLECLEHGMEQHYAESDPLCPVCSLVTKFDFDKPDVFELNLSLSDYLTPAPLVIYSQVSLSSVNDRAPPAMILS